MMLGSILADKIIPYGRTRSAVFANLLIIISVVPMMWLSLWSLCLGRLILGFACGIFIVICSVYMAETVPAKQLSTYGTAVNLGIVTGLLITSLV